MILFHVGGSAAHLSAHAPCGFHVDLMTTSSLCKIGQCVCTVLARIALVAQWTANAGQRRTMLYPLLQRAFVDKVVATAASHLQMSSPHPPVKLSCTRTGDESVS